MWRRILLLAACQAAVTTVSVIQSGHLPSSVLSQSPLHPAVRDFTSGSVFTFAVLNSHISDNDTSYTENITLIVTNYDSSSAAEVLVTSPFEKFVHEKFYVYPGESFSFFLPADIQVNYRDRYLGSYYVSNQSVTVTSTGAKVSVVVRNAHTDGLSEDDYVIYPLCSLGKSYRTVGDEGIRSGYRATNMWAIVATQDGTTIRTTPTVSLPVTINAGEVVTYSSDSFPMSNFQIDADKPVAVVSGAVCGFGYYNPFTCNHEAVMLFPMQDNGLNFPYAPFVSEDLGELMLFGQADSTQIFIDGEYFATFSNSQYYIFGTSAPLFITTDKPSYVVAVSSVRSDGKGSPFMAHIPSVNQFTNQTYIQVTTGLENRAAVAHLVRLQTDRLSMGTLTVDDWTVDPLFYQRQGRSEFYYADFPVPAGTHVIRSNAPTVKYSATVYGYSHFTAYAYTPGIDLPTTGTC